MHYLQNSVGLKINGGIYRSVDRVWGLSDRLLLTYDNKIYSSTINVNGNTAFGGSLFLEYCITDMLSVCPEIAVSYARVKSSGSVLVSVDGVGDVLYRSSESIRIWHVDIPVTLKYALPATGDIGWALFTGPGVSLAFGTNHVDLSGEGREFHWELQGDTRISNLKVFGINVVVGAEARTDLLGGMLVIDVSYIHTITRQFDDVEAHEVPVWNAEEEPEKYPVFDWSNSRAPDSKVRRVILSIGFSFPVNL